MRLFKALSLPFLTLAIACTTTGTLAAGDQRADATPPAAVSSPGGMIHAAVGEPVEFQVCGESFVGGEIDIIPVDSPGWCERLHGRGNQGDCTTFIASPPEPGIYTLRFLIIDDENDMETDHSVTIEVRGDGCQEPPTCSLDPPGPIMIAVGVSTMFELCYSSTCNEAEPFISISGSASTFCTISKDVTPGGAGGFCRTISCSPMAENAGMHTISFTIEDQITGVSTMCSVSFEVVEPTCMDPPLCTITPSTSSPGTMPGPLKVRAGNSIDVEVCGESQCGYSVSLSYPEGPTSWAIAQDPFDDDECSTYRLSPPLSAVGVHEIILQIQDNVNGQFTTCRIYVQVSEPCIDPPICTITPEGPLMAYVGEEFSFDVCGESQCEGEGEVTITPTSLPDWCSEDDLRFEQHCATITCTPPNNVEGMHSFEFEIEDLGNGLTTTCSIDIEVVCHLEPLCSFSETGPINVAVGEEIDLEFCGVAACNGHRARIEMSSRPPFITPAGHQKGGIDEEICLPIKGTPGPGDVGSWRVHILVRDLDTGVETRCDIQIIVTGPSCAQPPTCSIDPGEMINATPGETVAITVCAEPGCPEGAVMIEALELPEFCDPTEPLTGEVGAPACLDLSCTVPSDAPDGSYPLRFRITDTSSGQSVVCETAIVIGPPTGCVEIEPNNEIALCTPLDARDCLNIDCGAFVNGYLADSGDDVDLYCIGGLTPDAVYTLRIVGGVNSSLELTCAVVVCVDAQGSRIGSGGSSGVECAADESGTLFVGVSGCGDLDLDGQPDDPGEDLGGIGHGSRGSYQLLVSPLSPTAASLACHADMNGDGIVDTGDLGMLIGVFGELCAP